MPDMIRSDAVFGVKQSLMARFQPMADAEGPFYDLAFDFVLARNGA